jgi:hypothetical protein
MGAKEILAHQAEMNLYASEQDRLAYEDLDPRNKPRGARLDTFRMRRQFPALVSPRVLPPVGKVEGRGNMLALPPLDRLTGLTQAAANKARPKFDLKNDPPWCPTSANAGEALERNPSLFEGPYESLSDYERLERHKSRDKCGDPLKWRGIIAGNSHASRILTDQEKEVLEEIDAYREECQVGWDSLMEEYWGRLKSYQDEVASEPIPDVIVEMARGEVKSYNGVRYYVGERGVPK